MIVALGPFLNDSGWVSGDKMKGGNILQQLIRVSGYGWIQPYLDNNRSCSNCTPATNPNTSKDEGTATNPDIVFDV